MLVSNVDTGEPGRRAHNRLGGEVKHGVDLVLAEQPLDQRSVADVAVHNIHPCLGALERERRRDHGVALENRRARAAVATAP